MVSVAERFRHKFVALDYGGSNPFRHPIINPGGEIWLDALDLGSSAVKHEGSSPSRGTNTTRSL